MATQTMQAMGPSSLDKNAMARKPLPALPSPTLTNPDMVLPNEQRSYAPVNSPPRYGRPPSPSYLRDSTANELRSARSMGSMVTPDKREKRGLMSRKMMLLRSRTASGGVQVAKEEPVKDEFENFDSAYGSSPTLMDVGNLAPEERELRRVSVGGSSTGSDDMASLPQFLAKYENQDAASTDDEDEDEVVTPTEPQHGLSFEDGLEAKRRQQEEDEHTSALLSQRAEQILANAKKRLNLMEGNLRGARDLVAPLTTANLKRATSVGSSYVTPTKSYGARNRAIYDRPHYERTNTRQQKRLSAQASAPHLAEDFHQGHSRGFSETEIPDRPYTAFEQNADHIIPNGRTPNKMPESARNNPLRGSRSYDSLGKLQLRKTRMQGSPDPSLEPLAEDEGQQYHAMSTPFDRRGSTDSSVGTNRSESRTEDLREQMSSLKGRISSLRDRAREDNLRRQSMLNLREPSPLNNATVYPPELFYTSSPAYGQPALDTNAGVGWSSKENSPVVAKGVEQVWAPPEQGFTGSRNAFAEQERMAQQHTVGEERRGSVESVQRDAGKGRRPSRDLLDTGLGISHQRTTSGTAIVQSSKHRYSHHQQQQQRSKDLANGVKNTRSVTATPIDDTHSEAGDSVYEDASSDPPPPVVAHEDREDAFDYKNFFLLSAVKTYGRRGSTSSETSTTSTATARGPSAAAGAIADGDDAFADDERVHYPPPSPETPERLREIERSLGASLHKRTMSTESTSTVATFATATEGWDEDEEVEWPMPGPSSPKRPSSRPGTAIQLTHPQLTSAARSDSSSERADSGVGGFSHRSHSIKRPAPKSLSRPSTSPSLPVASPPMSPSMVADPTTVAVNALLAGVSGGGIKGLGLKEKALVFGVVEGLGRVVRGLGEGGERGGGVKEGELRRRLERARRALEGN
ncbi:uncharacterized protein LTR77_006942 [Saxophila tyrrhenica]|uniref:Uncharacterized protein n=1 Tax=Saxophila tyrrhenica TaxID=1690608 RepID=A0AAV9P8B1_9PEZI|nr:hypothetical protein LTR77_006942 [Saxophila tyrrhenica]